jgi:hypothetical protein
MATIAGGKALTTTDFPQTFSRGIAITETNRILAAHGKCVQTVAKLRAAINAGADELSGRSEAENQSVYSAVGPDAVNTSEWARTVDTTEAWASSGGVQLPADLQNMTVPEADELATQVAEGWLRGQGWPASREEAEQMGRERLSQELRTRGVPQNVIDAALRGDVVGAAYQQTVSLATNAANTYFQEEYGFSISQIPTSREAAEQMMESWTEDAIEEGTGYRVDLKIPRSWQEGAQAAALIVTAIVCQELGLDMRIGTVLVESMMDGRLDEDECASIGGVAGSVACGCALQAFGVPYPIGAFVGGILGSTIGSAIAEIFQVGEEERRKLRQQALEEACEAALAAHNQYSATCNQWRDAYYREFESSRAALESAWTAVESNPVVGKFALRHFPPATKGKASWYSQAACAKASGCTYPEVVGSISLGRAASAILARLGGALPFPNPQCGTAPETELERIQREDVERQREEITSGRLQPTWQELEEASAALDPTWAQRTAKMMADYGLRTHNIPEPGMVHAPYVSLEEWRQYELSKLGTTARITEFGPGQCEQSCFGPSWTCWGTSGLWGGLWNCDREYYYLKTIREVQLAFARLRTAVAQTKADLLKTATEVAAENYARAHAAEIQQHGLRAVFADITTKINGLNVFADLDGDGKKVITYKQRKRITIWRTKVAPVVKYGVMAGGLALLGYALLQLRGRRR